MKFNRSIPFLILSCTIALIAVTSLGFVYAMHKDPVREVKVGLTCTNGGCKLSATTDANGHFSFANVADGDYTLSCSYEECARAINTKGTGAIVREAGSTPTFEITFDDAKSKGLYTFAHDVGVGKNGSANRGGITDPGPNVGFTMSKEWTSETMPRIRVSSNGNGRKSRELTGSVYTMYSTQK